MTDNTPKIFAHIVGFNNKDKEQFVKDVSNLDYNVLDLNYITKKVYETQFYKDIKQNQEQSKSKFEKNAYEKCMFTYWKKKITGSMESMKNNKKMILIGMNTFDNNKMEIRTDNKLFIKHNLENNAKEIVKENLEKYHDKILDGGFSFDYIDKDFLIKKRQEIMDSFKKDDYKIISYQNLIGFLNGDEIHQPETQDKPASLYYVSELKYQGQIGSGGGRHKKAIDPLDAMLDLDREIVAYRYKWLAMLSHIPNHQKYFEKGFRNEKPYIKIIDKEGKKLLNEKCNIHVYEVAAKNFVKASDKNPYKFKSKWADIKDDYEVTNIGDEFKKLKILI